MRRIGLMAALLLAACNLQQQPPTPTPLPPTQPDSQEQSFASATPPAAMTPLPTLLPTPTQPVLVTATLSGPPTTVNIEGGGEGLPTLDAALADERYAIEARNSATLGLNYEVTIGARGVVSMTMQGPDGVVWQKVFTTSETGRAEVGIEQGGTYEVLVDRENLDGSYSVSWD